MIDKANLSLQAEMTDTDIASSQGAVHTSGLKDPHPIQGGPGHHKQEIGDHPAEGENPHLTLQTGGQDQGQDPRTRAGILAVRAVTPFSTSPMIPLTRIQASKVFTLTRLQERTLIGSDQVVQAKFEIQFDLKLEMSSIVKTLKFVQASSF